MVVILSAYSSIRHIIADGKMYGYGPGFNVPPLQLYVEASKMAHGAIEWSDKQIVDTMGSL